MDMGVIAGLVLRHLLTGLGAAAVTKGWFDESTATAVIGALSTLGGVIWSVFQKHSTGVLVKQ